MLDRQSFMRLLVQHGAGDRLLLVLPAHGVDAGGIAHKGPAAIGTDQKLAGNPASVLQHGRCPVGRQVYPRHRRRRQRRDRRQGRQSPEHSGPQQTVFDDVAERLGADFIVVVVQEYRCLSVGDADIEDRRPLLGDLRPDPRRVEQAAGAEGDRRGAAVEMSRCPCRLAVAVDHDGFDAGGAEARRQRQPRHAAADHDHAAAPMGGQG